VAADAFAAVRSLLSARQRLASRGRSAQVSRRSVLAAHRAPSSTGVGEGRWSLLPTSLAPQNGLDFEELAADVAIQLVRRWGVVTYELFAQESYRVPLALRRLGATSLRGPRRGARRTLRRRTLR
jgi:hypothetical protein